MSSQRKEERSSYQSATEKDSALQRLRSIQKVQEGIEQSIAATIEQLDYQQQQIIHYTESIASRVAVIKGLVDSDTNTTISTIQRGEAVITASTMEINNAVNNTAKAIRLLFESKSSAQELKEFAESLQCVGMFHACLLKIYVAIIHFFRHTLIKVIVRLD